MQLIGLTGGIGSGKTTAAKMMRAMGVQVIDVDVVARQVVDQSVAFIQQHCPEAVVDGALDRVVLAQKVFSDPHFRHQLDRRVHPRVAFRLALQLAWHYVLGSWRVVLDVPLLFESGFASWMSFSIVVHVCEEVQVERLCRRDCVSVEQAQARIAAQMPLAEKQRRATFVLDNSGTIDQLHVQVAALVKATRPGAVHLVYWLPVPALLIALLLHWTCGQ